MLTWPWQLLLTWPWGAGLPGLPRTLPRGKGHPGAGEGGSSLLLKLCTQFPNSGLWSPPGLGPLREGSGASGAALEPRMGPIHGVGWGRPERWGVVPSQTTKGPTV